MFTIYTTANHPDGSHTECPVDAFETLLDALDSLPVGTVKRDGFWTAKAGPNDGDGETPVTSYDFTIIKD